MGCCERIDLTGGEGLIEGRTPEIRGLDSEAEPAVMASAAVVVVVRIEAAGRNSETEQGGEKQEGKSLFRVHITDLRVGFSASTSLILHCSCQGLFSYRIASIGDSRAARMAG